MVNDYRRASEPPIKILSRKKIPVGNPSGSTSGPSLEERERRLSAAQSGVNQQKSMARADETLIGSSDEEEELDADVTFTERPKARPRPATSSPHLSAASSHTSTSLARPVASSSSQRSTSNQPRHPFSSLSGTATKPSSYTSPATNRPSPVPRPAGPPPSSANPAAQHRGPSPSHRERRPPVGGVRRRAEVDIFNRGPAKKPRVR
jgi:elongin-A